MRFPIDDDAFRCSPYLAESAALVAADGPLVELEDREIKTLEAERAERVLHHYRCDLRAESTSKTVGVEEANGVAGARVLPKTNGALPCRGTVLQRRRPTRPCPTRPASRARPELPLTTSGPRRVEPLRTSERYRHVGQAAGGPRRHRRPLAEGRRAVRSAAGRRASLQSAWRGRARLPNLAGSRSGWELLGHHEPHVTAGYRLLNGPAQIQAGLIELHEELWNLVER